MTLNLSDHHQQTTITMTTTRRSSAGGAGVLQPSTTNVVAAPKATTTPSKKVQQLEADLEQKNVENAALKQQVDALTTVSVTKRLCWRQVQ